MLLYVVGITNRQRINRFKRTAQFIPEDFDLLKQLLGQFETLITTPNILTEVNSLANQLGEPERSKCLLKLRETIAHVEEQYQKSSEVAANSAFQGFGLTDCGIVNLAMDQYWVLTDDLKLVNHLQSHGIDALNFNNLRERGWT